MFFGKKSNMKNYYKEELKKEFEMRRLSWVEENRVLQEVLGYTPSLDKISKHEAIRVIDHLKYN